MIPFAAAAASEGEIGNYLLSINRLYEGLDYELALNQIQLARQVPRGTEEDVTLDLYEGIILCEMGKPEAGSSSFKAALFLRPDAKLPVQVAPKVETLFESVRTQAKAEVAAVLAQHETAGSPKKTEHEEEPRCIPEAHAAATPASTEPELAGRLRVGVGGDLFFESARMTGVQRINATRIDESFDYASLGFLSGTAWLTTAVPTLSERLRVGAGLRIFGDYAASGSRPFGFGLLNEAFASGEYGLPVADKMEVVFGGRVGLSLLVPTRELETEISRLQEQGVSVWTAPRLGWLLGTSLGARRRLTPRIWLRTELLAQVEQQFLFSMNEEVFGFHFTKSWNTLALRLGFTVGAEFAL